MRPLQQSERAERSENLKWAADDRIIREATRFPEAPHVVRVLRLLSQLQRAETLRLELYPHHDELQSQPGGRFFADPRLQALKTELNSVLREVENQLKNYRWTPRLLSFPRFNALHCRYTWPNKRNGHWENWAVFWLLGQVDGSGGVPGSILRFRRCLQCGSWFYGLMAWAKFCGDRCRKKQHATSPRDKERNRRYMREYRRKEKERSSAQAKANDRANDRAMVRQRKRGA